MDEKTYLELGETISQLTESVLEGRFGECGRGDVPPTPGSSPTDPFPGQEQANGLPWYWAYLPYLDATEAQCATDQSTRSKKP